MNITEFKTGSPEHLRQLAWLEGHLSKIVGYSVPRSEALDVMRRNHIETVILPDGDFRGETTHIKVRGRTIARYHWRYENKTPVSES